MKDAAGRSPRALVALLAGICGACTPLSGPAGTATLPAPDREESTVGGLYYEARGSGPPVVFLHGFSLDRRMWSAEAAALADSHRVILYDQRGHGRSPAPEEPFEPSQDLASVLDALAVERAVLVGLSSGAEVAIDFAVRFPERVAGLVLASPGLSGYRPQGSFDWMGPVMAALREGDAREATERWLETPLMALPGAPEADAKMRAIVRDNADIWTQSPELRRPFDPPAIDRLEGIAVPTLVIVGEEDLVDTRHVGSILAERIPDAELRIIPGAGHLVNLAAPETFRDALAAFLGRVAPY